MKALVLLLFGSLLLLALISGCSGDLPTDQFTARMVETDGEQTYTSRIYYVKGRYRLEKEVDDNKLILLIDRHAGRAKLVSLAEQAYTEVSTTNPKLLRQDPFLAIEYLKQSGSSKISGQEKIQGYDCIKETLSLNNREVLTIWTSSELNFPIKIINHLVENKSIELLDISREIIPDSVMLVYDNYARVDPNPQAATDLPAWVVSVPGASLVETPFERGLREGEMLRLTVRPESSFWFTAEQMGSQEADVRAIPLQQGQPILDVNRYPNMVSEDGRKFWRGETAHEATEIVLRGFAGVAKITCWSVSMRQKVLQEGKTTIWRVDPDLPFGEFRLVNSGGDEARISWNFYEDGEPLLAESSSLPVAGQVILAPHEVKLSSFPIPGSEFHIRSDKGQALLSLGQWETQPAK